MGKVLRKLQSNNGATLMLALLFFIVCAVTGSMILTSAGVSAGRLENMKRRDQNYFAVRSAIKMCEQQMKEMNIAFTDQLVVTEVETKTVTEDEDGTKHTHTETTTTTKYNVSYQQFDDDFPICFWVKGLADKNDTGNNEETRISNYVLKTSTADYVAPYGKDDEEESGKASAKASVDDFDSESGGATDKEKHDAFNKKWFKGMVKDSVTNEEALNTLKVSQEIKLPDPNNGYSIIEDLNVDIDINLDSTGVLTYRVQNADTIYEKPNKDKYIMTLTVDVDVPCKSSVDVIVETDGDDEGTTTTTTTTTYTNEYKFDFKVRDIKKG
ncbi:hypothetical protein SAMN05216349_10824 [Oribacterium sp. KHPX15]|uniref:hypothetical protein n=1 Tax=Oribacterium sp. KHPX15 TaxID=1855342 RepID=UPI0008991980|nr:hypothetical protein [Oribacterium sp. KHPX15]SEA26810.1 hypothetical protein SAMN05216349_10824 [Oribacterium sp. KHPX15]